MIIIITIILQINNNSTIIDYVNNNDKPFLHSPYHIMVKRLYALPKNNVLKLIHVQKILELPDGHDSSLL